MDFITKKISEKSELNAFTENYRDAATQEQSRLEYILILIIGYLWNKNITKVPDDSRISCYQDISRPSIGTIVNLARKLDLEGEIFGGKKLKKFRKSINDYPAIRNEKIGHGFSFDDESEELYHIFSDLYKDIYENGPSFIIDEIDLINIISTNNKVSKGILYKANGEYTHCSIPTESTKLEVDCIYFRHNK